MRKEAAGKGKEMAPKVAKPVVLSAEAAAMEHKLAELRKAMEKERAKREALMSNMGGGSIWRNGGSQGGLRNAKGKGPGETGPSSSAAGGSAAAASASAGRRPGSGSDAGGSSRGAPFGSSAGGHPSGSASASGSGTGPQRSSSARAVAGGSGGGAGPGGEAMVAGVSGSRLTSTKPATGLAAKGKADILDLQGGGGGMSCGTDDGPSLAAGAFNEADSHRSFLEALNEWRKANRGDSAADGVATGKTPSSGTDAAPRPRSAVASSSLEVQTEARPASVRPSSAKPLSYFDKLVINTNSRQAGSLAAGESPEALLRSLSGQPSVGIPRPTSATRQTAPGGATTTAPAATPKGAAAAAAALLPPPPGPATKATAAAAATGKAVSGKGAAAPAGGAATAAVSKPEAAAAESAGGGGAPDPLSILDRLEDLERTRQAAAQEEDEWESEGGSISVTTAHGMVLTKGVRLPDEVLLPANEVC